MFRRLIVLVGVFVLLLGHSEAHAVLAPVKIYNVLSKVLKANAARAAATGKVHRGVVMLTSEEAAAAETAAVIARARASSAAAVRVASPAPAAAATTAHSWFAAAIASGVAVGVLTQSETKTQVVAQQVDGDAFSFKVVAMPWGNPEPVVQQPVYSSWMNEEVFSVGQFENAPISTSFYPSPFLYKVGVMDVDNPPSQSMFTVRFKNLPSSGYVTVPYGEPFVDPLRMVQSEIPVLHCYLPVECQKDFVQSFKFRQSNYFASGYRTTSIEVVTSDLVLETDSKSEFYNSYFFSYFARYQYTDAQGSYPLVSVDTMTKPKIVWVRPLMLEPFLYPDPQTMLREDELAAEAQLSEALLAETLNKLWMQAQLDGAATLYEQTFPLTELDVATALLGKKVPLSEFLSPLPELSDGHSSAECDLDPRKCAKFVRLQNGLGDDPHIPPPVLEDIPTVPMILDPIFNLFPSLRNFRLAPLAVCPTATLNFFERSFLIDQHCVVSESVRAIFAMFFSIFWAFGSLRIVLKS